MILWKWWSVLRGKAPAGKTAGRRTPNAGARSKAAAAGEHEWTKTDLVSGAHTNYKCELCGVKAVRYGLGWPPRIKGKRDLKKFGTCPGKCD